MAGLEAPRHGPGGIDVDDVVIVEMSVDDVPAAECRHRAFSLRLSAA